MPKEIQVKSVEHEVAISDWLRSQTFKGLPVQMTHSSNEGSILTDHWHTDHGYITWVTDLDNRSRLNRITCTNQIAEILDNLGLVKLERDLVK